MRTIKLTPVEAELRRGGAGYGKEWDTAKNLDSNGYVDWFSKRTMLRSVGEHFGFSYEGYFRNSPILVEDRVVDELKTISDAEKFFGKALLRKSLKRLDYAKESFAIMRTKFSYRGKTKAEREVMQIEKWLLFVVIRDIARDVFYRQRPGINTNLQKDVYNIYGTWCHAPAVSRYTFYDMLGDSPDLVGTVFSSGLIDVKNIFGPTEVPTKFKERKFDRTITLGGITRLLYNRGIRSIDSEMVRMQVAEEYYEEQKCKAAERLVQEAYEKQHGSDIPF